MVKLKKSIFTKLIVSFILYAIAMIITFVLCLFIEVILLGDGDPYNIMPNNVVDKDGNVINLKTVQNLGGWIEELDENYRVIDVYGEKLSKETAYSPEDIFALTSPYGKTQYVGFYIQPENSKKQFLCFYGREVIEFRPTIIINEANGLLSPGFSFMFFPLSLLQILLISLYLKLKIKNPLEKIIEGMEKIKSGDDGTRIEIKTEAEFEKIVDTFNVMAKQLQAERTEKELLTKQKNRMLLELSHDIKTPVATIKSYANALEAGLVPKEKTEETYRIIDAKANRVQRLTDDMFMMLKMDNPDYRLNLETVDLSEYLRQLCAEYYDEITKAGFDFDIQIPETKITAEIDAGLFFRVVENLLSNAKKYNRSGREISVRLAEEKEKIIFTVSDDGDKIDEAFVKELFNAFSRGDQARRTDGGTGLGLAISKIIVEKHGGEIRYLRQKKRNVFEVGLRIE